MTYVRKYGWLQPSFPVKYIEWKKNKLIIFESNSDFWKFILIYADDVSTLNIIPNFLNTTTGVMHNNKWIAGFNYHFRISWNKKETRYFWLKLQDISLIWTNVSTEKNFK